MKFKLFLLFMLLSAPAMAQQALPSINKSASITTGGTYQTITLPAGFRSSLDFVNICSISGNCNSTTDSCELHFGSDSATAANSIPVPAGYEYLRSSGVIPNDAIQITCTTTGDKFYLNLQ